MNRARAGFALLSAVLVFVTSAIMAAILGGWSKPLPRGNASADLAVLLIIAAILAFGFGYGLARPEGAAVTTGDSGGTLDPAIRDLDYEQRQLIRLIEGSEPHGLVVPDWMREQAPVDSARARTRSGRLRVVLDSLRDRGLIASDVQEWPPGSRVRLTRHALVSLSYPATRMAMTAPGIPWWWGGDA
jgi:hypothetical protein